MDVYKIECLDEQHAIIATLSIKAGGDTALRLGKAILTDAEMSGSVPEAVSSAMAYTTEPTTSDLNVWGDHHE